MTALRRAVSYVAATTVASAVLLPWSAPVARAAGFCGLSGFTAAQTYRWTGAAPSPHQHEWGDKRNWNHNSVPGLRVKPDQGEVVQDQYVCIGTDHNGAPARVTIAGGGSAHIEAIDVGAAARLTVATGGKLFVSGDPQSRPSYVRAGSTLALRASTLGGFGWLHVLGSLWWTGVETSDGHRYAATQTTRECALGATCSAKLARSPGRTVVEPGGRIVVGGTGYGGVNLEDQREIDNDGLVSLADAGYVAADHGTTIRNETDGRLAIRNDGGIYEGRGWFSFGLPRFVSNGAVTKYAGDATSVIGARVVHGSAEKVAVRTGFLSLNGDRVPTATVDQGGAYGAGACSDPVGFYCPAPVATGGDPQLASVKLPGAFTGTAQVTVAEETPGSSAPAGTIGRTNHVSTAGAEASVSHPQLYRFTYDASILHGRTLAQLKVYRRAPGGDAFVRAPSCGSQGLPPSGWSFCVDRRSVSGASRTLSGGDIRVVVRGVRPDGRWVVV